MHLGRHQLVVGRLSPHRPVVAPRRDARRTVVHGELDERDHRGQLDLGVRLRQVDPDVLVAVQVLPFGAGAAVEHVRDVELVARAAGAEDGVARGSEERVGQDLVGEDRRLARDAGDVARLPPEEPGDRVVEEPAIVLGSSPVEQRVELRVEPAEHVRVEDVLDDDGAVAGQRLRDVLDRRGAVEAGELGHGRSLACPGGPRPRDGPGLRRRWRTHPAGCDSTSAARGSSERERSTSKGAASRGAIGPGCTSSGAPSACRKVSTSASGRSFCR